MKRYIVIILAMMTVFCLAACGGTSELNKEDGKIKIVATIFPEYDWVKTVMGDKAEGADITLLLDNGVDLHSYQPTAEDILKISTCDMFIYVGGESDEWVEDALATAQNKDICVINLMKVLGENVKEEETVEGMQEEKEHDHEDGDKEYDEHVWLSLKNAGTLVEAIADGLTKIDQSNAQTYKANADSYISELKQLDEEYAETVDKAPIKTVLFGDRFPFRYMADDYGIRYYAAFVGCSAETEASFETISFLARKADELELPAVITIEGSDKKLAETIVKNTASGNIKILTMDSMQAATSKDAAEGITYISIMRKNLEVLREALKCDDYRTE
ncbi:MAG: zinc ABC transporter substrate-binding protein [Lachnospiraceae bacterium]|nr:zinc ABC transporter substrate-binding protein [Lachnospiraceae bacterium]